VQTSWSFGRRAGLLLPLSTARGRRGNLATYADAGALAKWLLSAGCTLWQHLPLSEVSPGQDSPYAASSSHALEPVYVDLDSVEDFQAIGGEASLAAEDREALERDRAAARVDFESVRRVKRRALERAFSRFRDAEVASGSRRAQAFARFREEHAAWLPDWALYRALHDRRHTSWRSWEPGLRDREESALSAARAELREVLDGLAYAQWIADEQWRAGRAEANAQGVKMVGDLPFMVAEDSADVWGLQRFFRFDATVGVPPDAYSAEGQDWGLPVPRWDEMRIAGDPWLNPRAERAAELYDGIRVDHVVGLYRTYVRPIDKGKPYFVPAVEHEQRAQGERILALLGHKADVLAEDLGVVPPFVRRSLAEHQIPGTKVLRWEDDAGVFRDPAQFPAASLAVTGTHDTEALAIWWEGLPERERRAQLKLPQLRALAARPAASLLRFDDAVHEALLEMLYASGSDSVLTPITDALGWRERLNTPGTVGPHNWTWRLPFGLDQLSSADEPLALSRRLASLAKRHRRSH
jgi:4-alpha-glucanotransferase